ncbi:MAG: DUF3800 domain-containing protein [Marichromatium sp.]|nr:DUF3800 domain-containing protein [Marichromatium sp.]
MPETNEAQDEEELSEEELQKLEAKKLKIEKEKKELLASLAGGNFSGQRTRVAAVLNLYPDSRNSDVTLTVKYWEMFQPDLYNESGILPKDLFKLERMHYIVRARAKIQNEYGLFQADEGVRRHRRQREEDMQEAVISDSSPRKTINVFADETGKNGNFVIVASVWVLTGRAVFTVSKAINDWKVNSVWANREVHFSKFGRRDMEPLQEYLGVILANREFLSFKAIAINKSSSSRSVEEIVQKLHEHMIIRGTDHEIHNNRIDLPREIEMTLDEEQSLDSFALSEMSRRISTDYQRTHDGQIKLCGIQTTSSKNSPLVQLSDLIAGAINRKMNHQGDRNHKDDMADLIIQTLDLTLNPEQLDELDSAALFKV